jgi:hypothetical protein
LGGTGVQVAFNADEWADLKCNGDQQLRISQALYKHGVRQDGTQ